jgi:hypothetical protein
LDVNRTKNFWPLNLFTNSKMYPFPNR